MPSFDDLDKSMRKVPGKYTWEHGLVSEMPSLGFDVQIYWNFDLEKLAVDTENYLLSFYGAEVGRTTIENSVVADVADGARRLLESEAAITIGTPDFAKIREMIDHGYLVLATVNQRVFQSDPGYVAHNVLIFGYSSRGIIMHNPGPPATRASEVTWDLFDRAWSFPDTTARNLMAFRHASSNSRIHGGVL